MNVIYHRKASLLGALLVCTRRALGMAASVAQEGFGGCTNIGECEAVCPKEIKLDVIAHMNGDFLKATWGGRGLSEDDSEDVPSTLAGSRR